MVGVALGITHNEGCTVLYFNMTGRQARVTDKPLHCSLVSGHRYRQNIVQCLLIQYRGVTCYVSL